MAHFLQREDQDILVIDQAYPRAASRVAAGMINPVTGRRYVKSWRIDTLLPFSRQTFRDLEKELDIQIYHERNIIRSLFNSREENDWQVRTAEPGYEAYLLDKAELGPYADHTVPAYSYGEVTHSAQVNLPLLIDRFREKLLAQKQIVETAFDHQKLKIYPDAVQYGPHRARGILFCEGQDAVNNPFFNHLPFRGAKGEVLIIRIPQVSFEKILKHRVFITPLGDGTYWVGSAYINEYQDDLPTEAGRQFLLDRLADILKTPFEVVEHRSAIRPTVKDRRPFLGTHPDSPRLHLFNGLGTKGASLGPFWAKAMSNYLVHRQPLDPAVDISRFSQA